MYSFNNTKQEQQQEPRLYSPVSANDVFNDLQIKTLHELAAKQEVAPAYVGNGTQGSVDTHTRRSDVVWIHPTPEHQDLFQHLASLFQHVNEKHYGFNLDGMEALQYTIYNANVAGEYKMHIDMARVGNNMVRKLSMSMLLSDPSEFEGGHLVINPEGNPLVMDGVKGRANFFPSWVPHCVTPVSKGVRKSLVIWAHGPAFK